jgi:hypothetical protein
MIGMVGRKLDAVDAVINHEPRLACFKNLFLWVTAISKTNLLDKCEDSALNHEKVNVRFK